MCVFPCYLCVIVLLISHSTVSGKPIHNKPCDIMELRRKISESCMHSRRSPSLSNDLLRNYYEIDKVPLSREVEVIVIETVSLEKIRRRKIREMTLLHKCCTVGCTAEDFRGACE